jgi:phosphatidylserine/phosphatidylglycerophosphate/cardiolipin synthase-like enzyme
VSAPEWVHAKLFIFDDEYAVVGTANASNRGYSHDSEATVGTAERGWDKADGLRGGKWSTIEANFARRLRIKLWEEHLRLPPEELFDGAGACAHWSGTLPSNAAVDVYHAVDLRGRRRSMTTYQEEMAEQETGGSHSSPPTMGMWSRARWWEAPYAEWAYLGSAGSPAILDPKGDE